MYIDYILNFITWMIIISAIPMYSVFKEVTKGLGYDKILKIKPLISTGIYLFVSVILCLSCFCKIKYLGTAIDIITLTLMTFVYSLVDIFYFQELKKDYIFKVQNQFIKKGNLKRTFDLIKLNGIYEQNKEHVNENYSVIKTENDGECIFLGGKYNYALKPRKPMTPQMLAFYAKYLSLHWEDNEEIPIFNNPLEAEKFISNYQFFKPSKIFLYIKSHTKIFKKIILIFLLVLLALLIAYFIIASQNWFGLDDWLKTEIG